MPVCQALLITSKRSGEMRLAMFDSPAITQDKINSRSTRPSHLAGDSG